MTYSEVREMYSMEALDYIEKREKSRKRVYSSISLLFSWLLPWAMSVTILILGINVLNAKSVMFSLLVLSLSLFLLLYAESRRKCTFTTAFSSVFLCHFRRNSFHSVFYGIFFLFFSVFFIHKTVQKIRNHIQDFCQSILIFNIYQFCCSV